jgi:trigger factor
MNVAIERISPSRVVMNITVDAAEVDLAWEKAYRKVSERVKVPGFRKGKAPRHLFERHHGTGVIAEEALDQAMPKAYAEALLETKLSPLDRPKVDVVKFAEHEPFEFKVEVEVKPPVELGAYTGLGIEKRVPRVTDDDVSREIEALRKRAAPIVTAESDVAVTSGDFAVIDFEGYVEGKAFEGGRGEGQMVEVGAGRFIPGFEDGLLGLKAGDEREIVSRFPDDYRATELAGKDATFKIKVKEIRRRALPAIDDEFAKQAGDYADVAAMHAALRDKLIAFAMLQSRREYEAAVVARVVDDAKVEPPDVMVEHELDSLIRDMEQRLASMGMTMEGYLSASGQTAEQLRGSFGESGRRAAKQELVLEAVARLEGLAATDDELDREIARMAKLYGQTPSSLKGILEKNGRIEAMRDAIALAKASAFLAKDFETAPEAAPKAAPGAGAEGEPKVAPGGKAAAASSGKKGSARTARKKVEPAGDDTVAGASAGREGDSSNRGPVPKTK